MIRMNLVELDRERESGYEDACEEINEMLSCPVCYALKFLAETSPAIGYLAGWRLAMIATKHGMKHSCPEFYNLLEEETKDA